MYGYEILHESIAEKLIENVRSGRAQHAYIFEGEAGVGAEEAAALFAAALVCENTVSAPCTRCGACIRARAKTHPDIAYITPADGKRAVTVDQIREVADGAYTKPFENKKKVYIISGEMNEQAQNAFLKVLEEPPAYAVFILLSQNHELLLQTIRSRCMLVHFAPVSDEVMRGFLRRRFPEEADKYDFLVKYSGGVAGNAEKILAQESFLPLRAAALDKLSELLSGNMLHSYNIAEFLDENKDSVDLILDFWLDFVRDIMLLQNDARALITNTDIADRLVNAAAHVDEARVVRAAEQLILMQKMRKRYVNLRAAALRLAFTIKRNGV